MKKVFSLLLVVAMLVSMSVVASAASANEVGGMHTVITETNDDITVAVYAKNYTDLSGFTYYLLTDDVTYVANSRVAGPAFASGWAGGSTDFTKTDGLNCQWNATDPSYAQTSAGQNLGFSFKVAKVDPTHELSASDFAYGTSAVKLSKLVTLSGGTVAGITAGNNFKNTSYGDYFTIEYVDERSSAPVDEFVNDTSSAVEGTTITCAGRVGAEHLSKKYGVEFTADSTVGGTRPQVFYGAKPGDTVSDGAGGTKTFVFDGWDGTFEIILQGVHAGTKNFRFFVGSDYTDLSSKVVSE